MGQEASLPANGGGISEDDEFEHQARAPPSSTNPPTHHASKASSSTKRNQNGNDRGKGNAQGNGMSNGGNDAANGHNHTHRHGAGAAGKMLGAVFQKARGPHGNSNSHAKPDSGAASGRHQNHKKHPPQLQQYDSFGARESAIASAGAGEMPYVEGHPSYHANGAPPTQPYPGYQPHLPHQQQPAAAMQGQMPMHMQITPEQQHQLHFQQQQHQNMYHMQQQQQHAAAMGDPYYQQQMQQNQQYHAQAAQHAYANGTQNAVSYPPHQDGQQVSSPTAQQQKQQPTGSGRKMLASLRNGTHRGAALINSMRNLSLTSAMQKATGANNTNNQQQKGGNVNEWETRWDEDEDDDSDEEIDAAAAGPQHAVYAAAIAAAPGATPVMVGPDGTTASHASAAAYPYPQTPSASSTAIPEHVIQQHELAQQIPPFTTPQTLSQPQQKVHLVTATPEASNQHAASGTQQSPDDLNWDASTEEQKLPAEEKPNVQMFLPLLRVLGKGSFGKVVLVQKRKGKERGALFAMKILRKAHLVKRRQIERTRTERKVLSVVNHPFIMKLHYAFQSPDKLYLVLDYCPGGELFFHLSRFRRFPERVARFYAAELLLAIGHLHKRGIIYRDLKPENVLLDADGHVKLGDFGLAKAGIKHPCEGAASMCGTPEYMAPEVLSQQGHGFCVDYWGLGMLLYEMMTGLPPWYTTDRAKLFRRLKSAPLDIPSFFTAHAAGCVSALLERNPRRRLGVTGIRTAMEHEFFRSISWRALYGRRVEAPIRPCEGWTPPDAASESGQDTASLQWHDKAVSHVGDLDAATANFDNTFTRMPVETDDKGRDAAEEAELEELHEDTFVGFTFDNKDSDAPAGKQSPKPAASNSKQTLQSKTSQGDIRTID